MIHDLTPSIDNYNIKRRIFITICKTMQLSGNLAWEIPVVVYPMTEIFSLSPHSSADRFVHVLIYHNTKLL